jgi:hypothetical protein
MFKEYATRVIFGATKCGHLCCNVNCGQLQMSAINKHQVYFAVENVLFLVAKGGIVGKYVVNLLLFMQPEVS